MKKKFWGSQSYWKWYGLAMTLLVTIINADYNAYRAPPAQRNQRRKSIKESTGPGPGPGPGQHSAALNATTVSMDAATAVRSQLERITPVPNTTEFHYDTTTERLHKGNKCPNLVRYHHHRHNPNQYDHNHHHQRRQQKRKSREKRHDSSVDSQRIEMIKQQILSKLGLTSTPNVTTAAATKFLLEALSLESSPALMDEGSTAISRTASTLDSEPDDFYGKTSEIIGFAEPGITINGQKLLEFSWSQDMAAADLNVKSAMLWVRLELKPDSSNRVRKTPPNLNFTFWVFRVIASGLRNATSLSGKDFEERTRLSASLAVGLSSLGWKTFDVTGAVKEWYASPHKERLRLLVECSGCGDYVTPVLFEDPRQANEWERPFLMIQPDPTVTRRVRRRAVDCSRAKRDQCCKQQFYIRFRDIGWHTWIIAPSGYYANYCRGDCGGFHRTPDTYINPHTYAIEDYKKINQYSLYEPCCAPVKFSSISMIYITPDQNVIKRDLPKMVVDECGCP